MKRTINIAVLFLIWPFILLSQTNQDITKGYSSWVPAFSADNAMLIGNGEMGAMVFGHPHQETIIMNHYALYLPLSKVKKPINQASRLEEIRQLIKDSKGKEAAQIPVEMSMEEGYDGQVWSDPYIPAFDLKLHLCAENIDSYQRSVNFETAEASVEWVQQGNKISRKQFISRADSAFILKITAEKTIDGSLSFARRPIAWNEWDYINKHFKNTYTKCEDNTLYYHSEFVFQNENAIAGYDGIGKILSCDGEVRSEGQELQIRSFKSLTLAIKIADFKTAESPGISQLINSINQLIPNYDKLLARHSKIHQEIYNRVEFNLDDEDSSPMSSEVMNLKAKEDVSNQMIEQKFYAARYNILCATGINPPNLQGIWGSSNRPPWSSDYTHDGNLPTAISSFMCSNMPELMMSYFNYHDVRLEDYRENAQKLYNCRGIQLPSHSSARGFNVHFDPTWCLSFWNAGAAWASHFYYDYWLYTGDQEFLKNRAYPFMKESALFFEDFLEEDENGKLQFNPSYSPENNPKNHPSQATINATMDIMLLKELLRNLLTIAPILNEDNKQIKIWENILNKLPAYQIDDSGYLKEWIYDDYQENFNHRHLSQLYGFYDRKDSEITENQELVEGVRKVLNEKMKIRRAENGGIMVFGLVQMAWVAANLGDEELTEEIIDMLTSQYWSDSQATYHDPDGLFNMDLSGGYQTAIIRTLIQSDLGSISLLPAKPKDWNSGRISGIKTRNQLTINSLNWSKEEFTCTIQSGKDQDIQLEIPENYKLNNNIDNKAISNNKGNLHIHFTANQIIELRFKSIRQ